MKCSICKYRNAVNEAIRHPNGITVQVVLSLGEKLRDRRHQLCDVHKGDNYSTVLSEIGKKISAAKLDYIPLESVWHEPVYVPRGDRQ